MVIKLFKWKNNQSHWKKNNEKLNCSGFPKLKRRKGPKWEKLVTRKINQKPKNNYKRNLQKCQEIVEYCTKEFLSQN